MADFSKNPRMPYNVRVPNKIRKRIAMHKEDHCISIPKIWGSRLPAKIKGLLPSKQAAKPKRGSMWSRFTSRIKKFLE